MVQLLPVRMPPGGSVRVKVAGLAVMAAVPIVILAGVVISQTYGASSRGALQTASLLLTASLSRYDAARTAPAGRPATGAERAAWFGDSAPRSAGAWDGGNYATWLLDPAGLIVAVTGSASASVPLPSTLRVLLGASQARVLAPSTRGVPFAYASIAQPDGWRLMSAYDATRDLDHATRSLMAWLAALGLLLALGVAAVVVAAGVTFGEPLRRLTDAVAAWRGGGSFEPGPLRSAPWEVRELARSFGVATTALRQREAELAQAQERQNLLVLEIHHRVKNNLQIVASLLNLQASRIRVPEARAEFGAARDRVRALATLHRHLYSDGELHTINMRSFLVELCGQLFQAMGEVAGERIVLKIEAPELRMSSDQAVPLALIVTEAVTNAVKYAFPGGRRGRVSVRLLEAAGQLDLMIEDDGVGIAAGSVAAETGACDGLGLQLIRGFTRQLGASLAVEQGPGTRYAVRLALKAPGPATALDPLDAA